MDAVDPPRWRTYASLCRVGKMTAADILRDLGVSRDPPIWADEIIETMGALAGRFEAVQEIEPQTYRIVGDVLGSIGFVNATPTISVSKRGLAENNRDFALLLGHLLHLDRVHEPFQVVLDESVVRYIHDDASWTPRHDPPHQAAQIFAEDLLLPAFGIYAKHVNFSLDKLATLYCVPRDFVALHLRRHLGQGRS